MSQTSLRFRQIHLDFHTSEHIARVGAEFDPDEFASTLDQARVDSVTCFARCHHGWMYFDTQRFPEKRHPHLMRNLLKEQIEACHARHIRVPIYTTIQWDYQSAQEHPEWLVVDERGCPRFTPLYEAGFYRWLCVNSPYLDYLKSHVQEILETLPTDGFFFDIVGPVDCSCKYCRAAMVKQGLEPSDAQARWQFALQTILNFKFEMTRFVRQFSPDCTIFYNAGHVDPRHRSAIPACTHLELESLPSGGWGYMHFPIVARYARNLGVDCMGMTGKFHTSWGDFHSYKNEAALQFECFQMLAQGTKCSVGDQLHPSGKIDPHAYRLIGSVYTQVERKEPWCQDARPVTEIGVLSPEEFLADSNRSTIPQATLGVTRMLEEGAHQFDIIDSTGDLSRYKVIILPDTIPTFPELAAKIESYLCQGGSVIASFESGMDERKSAFALKALGVRMAGEGPRSRDGDLVRGKSFPVHDYAEYILPHGTIGLGLPTTEHAMHIRGMEITAEPASAVLADVIASYFDRTYQHFCSHQQTPSSGQPSQPAIVRNQNAIYFSHPIFTQYAQNAPRWCKRLFLNALGLLLPEPLVRHNGPSTMRVTVNEQKAQGRWVIHLLHYIPERRGQEFDIIEDVIPVYGVQVSVRASRPIGEVVCVPEQQALLYRQENGRLEFTLPQVTGHQMVGLSFRT